MIHLTRRTVQRGSKSRVVVSMMILIQDNYLSSFPQHLQRTQATPENTRRNSSA
jgi:hypothetical protein